MQRSNFHHNANENRGLSAKSHLGKTGWNSSCLKTIWGNNEPSENHYRVQVDFPHVHLLDKQVALEVLSSRGKRKNLKKVFSLLDHCFARVSQKYGQGSFEFYGWQNHSIRYKGGREGASEEFKGWKQQWLIGGEVLVLKLLKRKIKYSEFSSLLDAYMISICNVQRKMPLSLLHTILASFFGTDF